MTQPLTREIPPLFIHTRTQTHTLAGFRQAEPGSKLLITDLVIKWCIDVLYAVSLLKGERISDTRGHLSAVDIWRVFFFRLKNSKWISITRFHGGRKHCSRGLKHITSLLFVSSLCPKYPEVEEVLTTFTQVEVGIAQWRIILLQIKTVLMLV